jgi:hypothetical protein
MRHTLLLSGQQVFAARCDEIGTVTSARPAAARRHRAGTIAQARCSVLLAALLLAPLAAAAEAMGEQAMGDKAMSGQALLEQCGGVDGNASATATCRTAFRDALAALRASRSAARTQACPPVGFDASAAIVLYREESRRFPEVLQVPAARLIEGMLLKFFPCIGT